MPPRPGRKVDASGITADGKAFTGIDEFKLHLFEQKEQIARNLVSKLAVYATGAEIQFADRAEIEKILKQTADSGYPLRDLVHAVVQSPLFTNK